MLDRHTDTGCPSCPVLQAWLATSCCQPTGQPTLSARSAVCAALIGRPALHGASVLLCSDSLMR
ncbi:hypothetical protein BC831DRAFT_440054 [Entophlyctis helioformis]|nr:hypothetical protein BC831DRAFT_440054 [Entophlyctis helioformis]